MTRFTSAIALGLAAIAVSYGQTPTAVPTPPVEDDVVQITTNLIQIDAIVTGKNKKQVTDLTVDDFEIFENGKKREISFFSYVSLDGGAAVDRQNPVERTSGKKDDVTIPTTRLSASEVRRVYAIVVDDLGISFENFPSIKHSLRKFVNEDVQQGDLVAIIRTGSGSGALQSFTSDKRQLLAAIDRLRWNAYGRSGISSFEGIRTTLKEDLAGRLDSEGNSTTPEGIDEELNFEKQIGDIRRSNFEAGTLGALSYVIRGMDELPGRKSIILFSEGFTSVTSDDDFPTAVFDQLKLIVDYANRASVTFYTIDPRGLQVPGMALAEDDIREIVPTNSTASKAPKLDARDRLFRDSISTLRYLAYETGGVPFVNNNSLTKGLDTALEDQKGYYLIAYEPDEETFDASRVKFNNISVRVKIDGLKVRTRNGFYAIPDKKGTPLSDSA
ncbi:MAG: VWA domain-containing protein, partial [Acidobacteriota bacterium]|nr:VWA domain-containing protein [Acidobacteriota bacterium]